jgi:nitrite reductase/ring-hydroxylating ferredoxin subunit
MVNVKVCSLEFLPPTSMKQFYVQDLEILLINMNNKLFCLNARCTHAGAPLEEGLLEGEILTCPWHGSQFQITDGKVIRGPAEKQLKTYPVIAEDNFVFIEI